MRSSPENLEMLLKEVRASSELSKRQRAFCEKCLASALEVARAGTTGPEVVLVDQHGKRHRASRR